MIEERKLQIEDLEEFISLRVEILLADKSINYDKDEIIKQTIPYFKENINKSLHAFGIFDKKHLVSVACMEIIKRLPTPRKDNLNSEICYICGVYTKPEYRKKGYANKLLGNILEYAKQIGITRFKLSSHNPNAIKIYEKYGFEKDENMMKK